jgi:hypothetical protein
MFLGLLIDGFHLAPRGMGALATPAIAADLEALTASVVRRLGDMQPRETRQAGHARQAVAAS